MTDLSRFAKLPTIVGDDHARRSAAQLLDLLANEPDLAPRVTAAVLVGDRRWDVRIDNAISVMLPEDDMSGAWARLAELERANRLLKREVETVDMRLPDRLVVRVTDSAVQRRAGGQENSCAGEEHMNSAMTIAAKLRPGNSGGAPPAASQQPIRPRSSLIAGVDIGSTKICCFIARVDGAEPRILGIGHQLSRGMKSGAIVNLDEVSDSIRTAVHAAEEMADETIAAVVVSLSAGFGPSRMVKAEIGVGGREISDGDMRHVLERGYAMRDSGDRAVIHSFPVGFSIDDSRGIRDPRGMIGSRLGVNMHIVTAGAAPVRNHSAAIGRAMLEPDAFVVSPYAAGLACLVEDEMNLGVTVIDMGGGTTTVGVFVGGNLVFTDTVPVGGGHVTNDIARGLSTPLAHAERLKALFGSAIAHDPRRAGDDRGAADRRRGGRTPQPCPEIAACQHSIAAAHRGNVRDGAQPARGRWLRQDRGAPRRAHRRRLPAARGQGTGRPHPRQAGADRPAVARQGPR